MIRLVRPSIKKAIPDKAVRDALAQRKKDSAALAPGEPKITSRWDSFVSGRGLDRGVGPVVCAAVRAFCHEKCAYCEAPKASSVDHVWPKKLHPARMFDWDNILAACRDCNAEKRVEFPLDAEGNAVLLDPTRDEPLTYFRWNHVTGECDYDRANTRAAATFDAFAMDRLARERLEKLAAVRFLFARVAAERPVPDDLRERLRAELDVTRPYLCIVRSYLLHPPDRREKKLILAALRALPELLAWVEPWLRPPGDVAWFSVGLRRV